MSRSRRPTLSIQPPSSPYSHAPSLRSPHGQPLPSPLSMPAPPQPEEYEFHPPGTPTAGVYSRDGLWDEPEEYNFPSMSEMARSTSPSVYLSAQSSRMGSIAIPGIPGRREGSMGGASVYSSVPSHGWRGTVMSNAGDERDDVKAKSGLEDSGAGKLVKQKSMRFLRGMGSGSAAVNGGKKFDQGVHVDDNVDDSFEAPPPLPTTPSTYITASPVVMMPTPSPYTPQASFPSPASPPEQYHHLYPKPPKQSLRSPINLPSPKHDFGPPLPASPAVNSQTYPLRETKENIVNAKAESSSSWKKGMRKLFKSKSHAALRPSAPADGGAKDRPLPPLPTYSKVSGKFASQTPPSNATSPRPPLGEAKRSNNILSFLSPSHSPASATTPLMPEHDFIFSHPSLPPDPFESALDIAADPVHEDLRPPSPQRRLRPNSPSIRDLRNMLSLPSREGREKENKENKETKPKLTKARSLANMRSFGREKAENDGAPLKKADKASGIRGLAPSPVVVEKPCDKKDTASVISATAPSIPPMAPLDFSAPLDSPELLPPNPAYLSRPISKSPSDATPPDVPLPPAPSNVTHSPSSSPALPAGVLTPITTTPLSTGSSPTSPSSGSPLGLSPGGRIMARSGSTPVLLPRSRSTSMSLKSPPTSSSFFDLYEQLGIWPKGENKDKVDEEKEDDLIQELKNGDGPVAEVGAGEGKERLSDVESARVPPSIETTASGGELGGSSSLMSLSSAGWGPILGLFPEGPSAEEVGASGSGNGSIVVGGASSLEIQFQSTPKSKSHREHGEHEEVLHTADPESSSLRAAADSSRSSSFYPAALEISMSTMNPRTSTETQATSVGSLKHDMLDKSARGMEREEDDIPLAKVHPEAALVQVQRASTLSHPRQQPAPPAPSTSSRPRGKSVSLSKIKVRGRNPGGDTDWDGEGGVPAGVLAKKLEDVLVMRQKWDSMAAQARMQASTEAQGEKVISSRPTRPPPAIPRDSAASGTSPLEIRKKPSQPQLVAAQPSAPPAIPRAQTKSIPIDIVPSQGGIVKRIPKEVHARTTAKDMLSAAYQAKELSDAEGGLSWVVCEVFAEMNCERHVREYETIQSIMNGWEQGKGNRFEIKQSTRGVLTWARTVPTTPPMFGGWVMHESKKGKWSRRWLETRGGHVFLAKNDKGKDEVHLNTLFFDVYSFLSSYNNQSHAFMLKRSEAAGNFEKREEWGHVFACESNEAFKLVGAIHEARSYTLAQTYPHSVASQRPVQARPTNGHAHAAKTLVNLAEAEASTKKPSPFTGKGLLRI
ncbi:hypothetical protein B9479_004946 [Cryptococcus floricola]|uniref:PH domain-containing protein n=1 Tax=Cryptococcus floricola TaxID=2591691 RepID=A0A5D3AX74_9TREE|nr:hypothetical protein B9479_004946 [Cryptococcus floricola]